MGILSTTREGLSAIRRMFPFSREGRQTLIYLVFAGCGPALTGLVIWAMTEALEVNFPQLFRELALIVASAMFVIVTGLAMFVSIRALKIGKDGFEAGGYQEP